MGNCLGPCGAGDLQEERANLKHAGSKNSNKTGYRRASALQSRQQPPPSSSCPSALATTGQENDSSRSGGMPSSPSSPSCLYNFPQLTEKEKEHWKVFNELDNKDEADMRTLGSFFQTLCATAASKQTQTLFPPVDEARSRMAVKNIRIQGVGRIDSNLHDLREYQIPVKSRVTMDVALDIIDCYRRGGKLHLESVHKILKAMYWLLKKFPNVREVNLPPATHAPPLSPQTRATVPSFSSNTGGDTSTTATPTTERAGGFRSRNSKSSSSRHPSSSSRHEEEEDEDGDEVAKLVVCGDLHGQFFDLLYILDLNGPPTANNKYLFNGDFVDRGPNSVEVILTLFALQLAAPEHVYLNKGNHEHESICCLFGFMRECLEKYDEMTFSMFIEVFRFLPLATTINDQVVVLHGGLFHDSGVLLEDIQRAPRQEYGSDIGEANGGGASSSPKHRRRGNPAPPSSASKRRPPKDDDNEDDDEEGDEMQQYLSRIMRDLMWSDPKDSPGVVPNPRGEGVLFGPDVTEAFLRENSLRMLIRSHECVPLGFEQPYERSGMASKQQLCTIFSASNYSQAGNQGAFMRFFCFDDDKPNVKDKKRGPQGQEEEEQRRYHTVRKLPKPAHVRGAARPAATQTVEPPENLHYSVHCFYMGDEMGQEKCLERSLQASLVAVVLKRRESLLRHFEALDLAAAATAGTPTGLLTVEAWAEGMRTVTKVQVNWAGLLELLVQEDCLVSTTTTTTTTTMTEGQEEGKGEGEGVMLIKYRAFLESFAVQYGKAARNRRVAGHFFDALYVNRRQLEALFAFFDKDKDGSISRDEFRKGCEVINAALDNEEGSTTSRILEVDRLLELLDFDRNDSIQPNEFFEAFRLTHPGKGNIKDGAGGWGGGFGVGGSSESQEVADARRNYEQAERRRSSSRLLLSSGSSVNDRDSLLRPSSSARRSSPNNKNDRSMTSPYGA